MRNIFCAGSYTLPKKDDIQESIIFLRQWSITFIPNPLIPDSYIIGKCIKWSELWKNYVEK